MDARADAKPAAPKYGSITFQQLRRDTGDERIEAGMPAAAVYRQLWAEEFKWEARARSPVVIPKSEDPHLALFIAACFGSFAARGDLQAHRAIYEQALGASELPISPSNYLDGLPLVAKQRFLTPLAITTHGLALGRARRFRRVDVVLVDTDAPSDLVDLWNYRASGYPVLPVPLAWSTELLPELGRRLAGLPPPSDRWGGEIGVVGCRRVSEDTVKDARDQLAAAGADVYQSYYPSPGLELGAAWATAVEDEAPTSRRGNELVLPLPEPPIAEHYPWSPIRWINVINYDRWSLPRDGSIAGLLPPALGSVSKLLGHYTKPDVRASREGWLVPGGVPRDHIDLIPPSGEQVMSKLLTGDPAGGRPT